MKRLTGILLVMTWLLTACGLGSLPSGALPGGEQTPPAVPALPAVAAPRIQFLRMLDPAAGWAVTVDARLLRTTDGGLTWYDATPGGVDLGYGLSPFFLDEAHAWFLVMDTTRQGPSGYPAGVLYRTSDGGLNWRTTPVEFSGTLFFLDPELGFALADLGAGAGSQYVAIYRTTDGGASWTQVFTHAPGRSSDLPSGGMKSGLVFSDAYNAWIGGSIPMDNALYFFHSETGGATWSPVDLPLPAGLGDFFAETFPPQFFNAAEGILPVRLMVLSGGEGFAFYRTTDGGATWTAGKVLPGVVAYDFVDSAQGFATDGFVLFASADGGASWRRVAGAPDSMTLLRIDFVDELHGWALASADPNAPADLWLYRTSDGGRTWERMTP